VAAHNLSLSSRRDAIGCAEVSSFHTVLDETAQERIIGFRPLDARAAERRLGVPRVDRQVFVQVTQQRLERVLHGALGRRQTPLVNVLRRDDRDRRHLV